jgi:hypothetical protein
MWISPSDQPGGGGGMQKENGEALDNPVMVRRRDTRLARDWKETGRSISYSWLIRVTASQLGTGGGLSSQLPVLFLSKSFSSIKTLFAHPTSRLHPGQLAPGHNLSYLAHELKKSTALSPAKGHQIGSSGTPKKWNRVLDGEQGAWQHFL